MYSVPKDFPFLPEEIFPKKVIADHMKNGILDLQIWRLIDSRIIYTLHAIRNLHGTTVVNDYLWGGNNSYRGYRPPIELVNLKDLIEQLAAYNPGDKITIKALWSGFTSQHCLGQAIDCKFKYKSADEVREHIKTFPQHPAYKYITAVEDGVSWLHFDVRNWDVAKSGVLFF